LLHDSTTYD